MKFNYLFLLISVCCSLMQATVGPGCLDNSFGDNGVAVNAFFGVNNSPRAVIMQPDKKIIVGGATVQDFLVARYDLTGTLDNSFGNEGKVTTDFSTIFGFGSTSLLDALALQSDGKIVAGGEFRNDDNDSLFALARYNSDGTLDESFGPNGTGLIATDLTAILGTSSLLPTQGGTIRSLLIQSDGKILAAGRFRFVDPFFSIKDAFVLARYNADGTLDTSFGDGKGVVKTDFSEILSVGRSSEIFSIVLQEDGKIVAGGFFDIAASEDVFALARYNADGSLDTSFGPDSNGLVLTDFSVILGRGDDSTIRSLVIQKDGKIVAGGFFESISSFDPDFALARYNSDGTLDTSFGENGNGLVVTEFSVILNMGVASSISSLSLQVDGRIVAGGFFENDAAQEVFALARYNTNGTLDKSFGINGNGLVVTDFSATLGLGDTDIRSMTLQSEGKIIVVGEFDSSIDSVLVARYLSGVEIAKVSQAIFGKYALISDKNKQL